MNIKTVLVAVLTPVMLIGLITLPGLVVKLTNRFSGYTSALMVIIWILPVAVGFALSFFLARHFSKTGKEEIAKGIKYGVIIFLILHVVFIYLFVSFSKICGGCIGPFR